ncbi:alcohol dehydrogenase-like 1 protein [Tanacetum coccineum]
MVISSPCLTDIKNMLDSRANGFFTMLHSKELASPKKMSLSKDISNLLIVDSLLKTIWLSMHHVIPMKHWELFNKHILGRIVGFQKFLQLSAATYTSYYCQFYLAIKGAQMQGASKIIGVDVNENKAAKGKAFGMTHFINPKDRPKQSVSDMEIELDELLTHEIWLENIHEVFEILKKPDCVKILINFD